MNKPGLTTERVPLDIRVRNGEIVWGHIEAEYVDVVDDIIATLAPNEPYAYTVTPTRTTDGSIPYQEIKYTKADIRAAYESMHRFVAVRRMQAISEIRTDWYVFTHGLGEGYDKGTGETHPGSPVGIVFPTMGQSGITGELFWIKMHGEPPYTGGRTGAFAAEAAGLDRLETLINYQRNADVEGILSLFDPGAQTAVRDYVNDTGTLIDLHSPADLRAYLDKFFARYEIHEISLINRYVCDWLVFAELMWVVEEKSAPGKILKFYTAEQSEVRTSGLFASRVGHGTPATPV